MLSPHVHVLHTPANLGGRLMALPEAKYIESMPKGFRIYREDEERTHLYYLREGRVRLTRRQADGRDILRAMVFPGEIFGEESLFASGQHGDHAEVCKQASYVQVPLEAVRQGLATDPTLTREFVDILGEGLVRMRDRQINLLFEDARTRILSFLREVVEDRGEAVGYEILVRDFGYTHQDIAHLVGTSRQTVTTVLNELKEGNLIHLDRRNLLVRDLERLG